MTETVKLAGLAHSKLRNAIGFVGIEANPLEGTINVKLAKHWDRKDINKVAPDVAEMFDKYKWTNTIVDLAVGEGLLATLRRKSSLPMRVIFIKKKVTDVSEIRRVKSMDLIDMVQYMLQLKLAHKIRFGTNPSPSMKELEDQTALYAEHSTEAGGINYYAPGDELDDLIKALITVSFACRPFLQDTVEIQAGPVRPKQVTIFDIAEATQPKIRKRRNVIHGI